MFQTRAGHLCECNYEKFYSTQENLFCVKAFFSFPHDLHTNQSQSQPYQCLRTTSEPPTFANAKVHWPLSILAAANVLHLSFIHSGLLRIQLKKLKMCCSDVKSCTHICRGVPSPRNRSRSKKVLTRNEIVINS